MTYTHHLPFSYYRLPVELDHARKGFFGKPGVYVCPSERWATDNPVINPIPQEWYGRSWGYSTANGFVNVTLRLTEDRLVVTVERNDFFLREVYKEVTTFMIPKGEFKATLDKARKVYGEKVFMAEGSV